MKWTTLVVLLVLLCLTGYNTYAIVELVRWHASSAALDIAVLEYNEKALDYNMKLKQSTSRP